MSVDIGTLYKTKIPSLTDAADIQAALKLYHYGSSSVPTLPGNIEPYSIAGNFKRIDDSIVTLSDAQTIAGEKTFSSALVATSTLGVTGTFTANGNSILGNDNQDTLTINATTTVNSTITSSGLIAASQFKQTNGQIILGNVTTPTDTSALNGGIVLRGATEKSITWATGRWNSTEDINVASGKVYRINGSSVLTSTTVLGITGTNIAKLDTAQSFTGQQTIVNSDAQTALIVRGNGTYIQEWSRSSGTYPALMVNYNTEITTPLLSNSYVRRPVYVRETPQFYSTYASYSFNPGGFDGYGNITPDTYTFYKGSSSGPAYLSFVTSTPVTVTSPAVGGYIYGYAVSSSSSSITIQTYNAGYDYLYGSYSNAGSFTFRTPGNIQQWLSSGGSTMASIDNVGLLTTAGPVKAPEIETGIIYGTGRNGTSQISLMGIVSAPYTPAFQAHCTVAQAYTTAGTRKILYQSANTNAGNCYDSSTSRFTAPMQGSYHFSVTLTQATATGNPVIKIYKNGAALSSEGPGQLVAYNNSNDGTTLNTILQLSGGDYIEVYVSTGEEDVTLSTLYNKFSGFLIG